MSYFFKSVASEDILSIKVSQPEIFEPFKSGSQEGFRKVFDIMCTPLVIYCRKKLDYFHLEPIIEPEDLVADAFLKLYSTRDKIMSGNHLVRHLSVILKNQVIDLVRKRQKEKKFSSFVEHFKGPFDDAREEEERQFEAERLGIIYKAYNKLSPQRRAIFKAYFIEQKTTQEIASEMNVDKQTVLNHKTLSINEIRKQFQTLKPLIPEKIPIKSTQKYKKVKCITTGEVFDSISQAARAKFLSHRTIIRIIGGDYQREPEYLFELV